METAKSYAKKRENGRSASSPAQAKGEEFTYEIKEHIGVLRTSSGGWTKELNVVSWNGNPEKYDLREWSEDHKKMSRGITLTPWEAKTLFDWFSERDMTVGIPDEA
ncbi:MAG: hypothetical protein GXY56_02925 [Clostridiales bacterium]|nr:hypothetical protein [Clostridiales bacterium]